MRSAQACHWRRLAYVSWRGVTPLDMRAPWGIRSPVLDLFGGARSTVFAGSIRLSILEKREPQSKRHPNLKANFSALGTVEHLALPLLLSSWRAFGTPGEGLTVGLLTNRVTE